MRVKITQKGWECYNADLAGVLFVNGVSSTDMSRQEAMRLGAFVSVVEINEAGEELGPVSPAEEMVRISKMTARVDRSTMVSSKIQTEPTHSPVIENLTDTVADDPIMAARVLQALAEKPLPPKPIALTQVDLEAIASEKGINGLREIGNPLGVKNTSVRGLISEILVAQSKPQG